MKSPISRASVFTISTGLCLFATAAAGEIRTFHSADGRPLKASLESVDGDNATLRREDGKIFEIALAKLSAEDRVFVKSAGSQANGAADQLNKAAGHDLATGTKFSSRDAGEIAKALKLRPESKTKFGQSWRLYAAYVKDYKLFGAMPYSVALYAGEDGKATAMSIVYANKGDFGSTAGFAEDHFKGGTVATRESLEEAMAKDEKSVSNALTGVLGKPKSERYGDSGTRRTISRWDWNGYSFLLSNEEGEYVSLGVVPTATAEAGGRSSLTKDADVKARLLSTVVKSENGDVYLTEIPMVDQGPKGYCVPATFERVMRTMGLEADMYLLAMVGQSGAGGGTSVELLLENLRHQVLSKGRRLKEEEIKELKIRDLKRYIDQGIPVMWTLFSVEEYNKSADKDTAGRAKVTDWNSYSATLATSAAKIADNPKPDDKRHICMIIGYNEATGEIAVSDSWGARFERRWVPLSVANWASSGRLVMILP